MIVLSIAGATRRLGKAQGYLTLPIMDTVTPAGAPVMISAWEPTPADLERLTMGAPIYLMVVGTQHPPVMLEVGEAPNVAAPQEKSVG